jgi:hypothetical protein
MANPLLNLFKYLSFERPAARRSYGELAAALERSAAKLERRLAAAADTPTNRKQLRHIIAIERWGQRRLRVALGEPPVTDESDAYQPPSRTAVPELLALFAAARRETILLARQLEARRIDPASSVVHNQFGILSVRAWLVYLHAHANREAQRVRR